MLAQKEPLPKILLVDDEPRILRSLKAALKHDYEITTASNGLEAKMMLQEQSDFSAIISDEKMPKMLGHELLIWCKQNIPTMARILITGYSDINAMQRSVNDAEIYRYVAKPWKVSEIKNTIAQAIIHFKSGFYFIHKDKEPYSSDCQLAILNVLDDNDKIFKKVCKTLSLKSTIVNNLSSLTPLLEKNKTIGVLFIDDDHADEETVSLVLDLHQMYPQLVIVIATSASDGVHAIKLLNEGQIFRFLVKPITETKLEPMLKAAVQRHADALEKQQQLMEAMENDSFDNTLSKYWDKFVSLW
jgi:DNA-binding NtrC family response regulator